MRSFSAVVAVLRVGSAGSNPKALHRNRAAVHAAQDAVPFEDGEVAADRLGRDLEHGGQLGDVHPSGSAGGDDDVLTLLCVYVVSPPFTAVSLRIGVFNNQGPA